MPWRSFRRIWICTTNGLEVYALLSPFWIGRWPSPAVDLPAIAALIAAVILFLGIGADLAGSRSAKYINVGYHLSVGLYVGGLTLLARLGWAAADPEMPMAFALVGLPSLFVAGVNYALYRQAGGRGPMPTSHAR